MGQVDVNRDDLRQHKAAYEARKQSQEVENATILADVFGLTVAEIAFVMDKNESSLRFLLEDGMEG